MFLRHLGLIYMHVDQNVGKAKIIVGWCKIWIDCDLSVAFAYHIISSSKITVCCKCFGGEELKGMVVKKIKVY